MASTPTREFPARKVDVCRTRLDREFYGDQQNVALELERSSSAAMRAAARSERALVKVSS